MLDIIQNLIKQIKQIKLIKQINNKQQTINKTKTFFQINGKKEKQQMPIKKLVFFFLLKKEIFRFWFY